MLNAHTSGSMKWNSYNANACPTIFICLVCPCSNILTFAIFRKMLCSQKKKFHYNSKHNMKGRHLWES